jgi:ParB family transcriptional regulator, chromosome partitioning protein
VRQTFLLESGWKIVVSANKHGTYHEIEQALQEALEEVRHRIANNSQLY